MLLVAIALSLSASLVHSADAGEPATGARGMLSDRIFSDVEKEDSIQGANTGYVYTFSPPEAAEDKAIASLDQMKIALIPVELAGKFVTSDRGYPVALHFRCEGRGELAALYIVWGLVTFVSQKSERLKSMVVKIQVGDGEVTEVTVPYIDLEKKESGKKQLPGNLYKRCVSFLKQASERAEIIKL